MLRSNRSGQSEPDSRWLPSINTRVEDARHKLIDFALLYAQYGPDRPADRAEIAARMDPGGAGDGMLRGQPEQKG